MIAVIVGLGILSGLPKAWEGNWAGPMDYVDAKGGQHTIQMELRIQPIEAGQTWTIIYHGEKDDQRNYAIRSNPERDHGYIIDEKNGILLDAYLKGDTLISSFSVGKTLLVSRDTLEGETLIHEIDTYDLGAPRKTKSGDEEALSYFHRATQTAKLKKHKQTSALH